MIHVQGCKIIEAGHGVAGNDNEPGVRFQVGGCGYLRMPCTEDQARRCASVLYEKVSISFDEQAPLLLTVSFSDPGKEWPEARR